MDMEEGEHKTSINKLQHHYCHSYYSWIFSNEQEQLHKCSRDVFLFDFANLCLFLIFNRSESLNVIAVNVPGISRLVFHSVLIYHT